DNGNVVVIVHHAEGRVLQVSLNGIANDAFHYRVGRKYAIAWLRNPEGAISGEISDRTSALASEIAFVNSLRGRLEVAQRIRVELASGTAEESEIGKRLTRLESTIKRGIYGFARELSRIQASRTWTNSVVDSYRHKLSIAVQEWDKLFTAFLSDKSLSNPKRMDEILLSYYARTFDGNAGSCLRCGTMVKRYTLKAVVQTWGPRVYFECPVCGMLNNVSESHSSIAVLPLITPSRGCTYRVQLSYLREVEASAPDGYLCGEVTDKSTGESIFQFIEQGRISNDTVLKIPLPSKIGSDLHTLRIFWVSNLEVSLVRHRFSIL
ncbi:hypothetical protein, partial [Sulfobacillus harzensis]|uniref:hypothetical protein n=1 Tax=Sulfobacillus harzensis TaxID=2729629 RepID=UPI001A9B45F4